MPHIGREFDTNSISSNSPPYPSQDVRNDIPNQTLFAHPGKLRTSLAVPLPSDSQSPWGAGLSTSQPSPAHYTPSIEREKTSQRGHRVAQIEDAVQSPTSISYNTRIGGRDPVGPFPTIHHSQPDADSEWVDRRRAHVMPGAELSCYLSGSQAERPRESASDRNTVSTFQGAHNFTISGNPRFFTKQENVQINYGANGLDLLKPSVSFSALYDSSAQDPKRRCHPGTRINVLKQACDWVDNPTARARMLWIHGPAGVGKSAIAQTLAHDYSQDIVSATFFFFRSDPTRNDGKLLFPTLAWQLAHNVPEIWDYLSHILIRSPDLPTKALEKQFKELVYEPFNKPGPVLSRERLTPRVIIIDGLDECSSRDLQREIIEVIGKADSQFPLRFIILSRPEAHIVERIARLQCPVFRVDLGELDSAYHDIEMYLTSEFYRIAIDQKIDPLTWPGPDIIGPMVQKSFGQFIYASTIIRFVGDEFNSARSQLDIVIGLKPRGDQSPFAELDALYMDVLQRQPDQNFIKDILALFVLCTKHPFNPMSIPDLTLLLNIDEHEIYRKLRGMHSVLKIGPTINVHHKSFLEFLQEPSRACRYHSTFQRTSEIFLDYFSSALVRHASSAIGQLDWIHGLDHFRSHFESIYWTCDHWIQMPQEDWEEVMHQSLRLRDVILSLPKFGTPLKRGLCDRSSVCPTVDVFLLQTSFLHGVYHTFTPSSRVAEHFPSVHEIRTGRNDLDSYLIPLLNGLCSTKTESSMPIEEMKLLHSLLSFDPCEIASKIRSRSDAQNLVDLIFHVIRDKDFLTQMSSDAACSFPLLALEINAMVPLIPRALIVKRTQFPGNVKCFTPCVPVSESCEMAFIWCNLCHNNIIPLLGIVEEGASVVFLYQPAENGTIHEWQRATNPTFLAIRERALEVAKAIQYVHSVGTSMGYNDEMLYEVYIDSNYHAKLVPNGCLTASSRFNFEYDVYRFGWFFSSIYFGVDGPTSVDLLEQHQKEWQLVQRCCTSVGGIRNRPSMTEIVEEMESWRLDDSILGFDGDGEGGAVANMDGIDEEDMDEEQGSERDRRSGSESEASYGCTIG